MKHAKFVNPSLEVSGMQLPIAATHLIFFFMIHYSLPSCELYLIGHNLTEKSISSFLFIC